MLQAADSKEDSEKQIETENKPPKNNNKKWVLSPNYDKRGISLDFFHQVVKKITKLPLLFVPAASNIRVDNKKRKRSEE